MHDYPEDSCPERLLAESPRHGARGPDLLLFAEGSAWASMMVGLGGLEPPASPLSGERSNHLSYRPGKPGGADRDRTDDPLLAKQVLSQLSYSPV